MSEQLDEDAVYNQPCRLREDIHDGRLKIKQAFVKQHPEHHLAGKIVKERGQERVAEGNQAGRAESKPTRIVVISVGWLVDKFVEGQVVAMERKMNPRLHLGLTAHISSCTFLPAVVQVSAWCLRRTDNRDTL